VTVFRVSSFVTETETGREWSTVADILQNTYHSLDPVIVYVSSFSFTLIYFNSMNFLNIKLLLHLQGSSSLIASDIRKQNFYRPSQVQLIFNSTNSSDLYIKSSCGRK
jgi:hypothetical protein